MVRNEYLRFMQRLVSGQVQANVHKMANLVYEHFDEIEPLGTSQGQRVKKIVQLALKQWNNIPSVPPDIVIEDHKIGDSVKKLKSINIGPFRGFAKEELLTLHSSLVLIYGPNGTGKSSFCEALEYSLLGSVAEADSKRFKNQSEYLKNAYTDSFSPPRILGIDEEGNEVSVQPNEAQYRFCFVEKNRIDNFSRIAAQAPAKQTELVSTLFGLDAFNDFVKNFTSEIDGKYIDLVGAKATALVSKKQTLAGFNQQIKEYPDTIKIIEAEESALGQRYRNGCTFSQLILEINGIEPNIGLVSRLERELQQPIPIKTGLSVSRLNLIQKELDDVITEFNTKQKELTELSQQVSFKQLYESLLQLQTDNSDICPACKTPLSQTTINPYKNANEELTKLQHLATLESRIKELSQNKTKYFIEISQIVNKVCSQYSENIVYSYKNEADDFATDDWYASLHQPLSDGFTAWVHLEVQIKDLEDKDKITEQSIKSREQKQKDLDSARGFAKEIIVLQTRRQTVNHTFDKAREAIKSFDEENSKLITEVEAEKNIVAQNQIIISAYSEFVQRLTDYKASLPGLLVADLSENVTKLYNAFNRYDARSEQLAAVELPLEQNKRLMIAYQAEPNKFYDALHVFSEGHIRCIGLAILLAKNIKTKSPFLIFDDPVNAIDDEHRKAIRETLFKDEFFRSKQIILACHGEEFFKDTHQVIGKQAAKEAESYIFKPQAGERHVQVCSILRPKNYVLAANELYAVAEYRDALMSSRRALEYLCNKVWEHYGKYCDDTDQPISVSRRHPQAPWDLRALADNLRSKVNKSKAQIPNKEQIVKALDTLLGVNGTDPHWVYLNKGTHEEEDRFEFDSTTVNTIISSLNDLEVAIR